eukprot:UN17252
MIPFCGCSKLRSSAKTNQARFLRTKWKSFMAPNACHQKPSESGKYQ